MKNSLLPLLTLFLFAATCCAQNPALLDASFHTNGGTNNLVSAIIVQPDNKILFSGTFTTYYGAPNSYIARVHPNGTPDGQFLTGTGFNDFVNTIALQTDGKILAGGAFTGYNGYSVNHLVRLHPDGSIDTTFVTGSGTEGQVDGQVNCMIVQPDGKIVVGGYFLTYNGEPAASIVRLNGDGSRDTSFHTGAGIGSDGAYAPYIGLHTILRQQDNKLILVGRFNTYDGYGDMGEIIRIHPDGELDSQYALDGTAIQNGGLSSAVLQPDGKLLLGGYFNGYQGDQVQGLLRFHEDGTVDTSFDCGYGTGIMEEWTSRDLEVQDDGKIIVVGRFLSYDGTARNNIARILPDGSIDHTFNPGTGTDEPINVCTLQSDGKILIGGHHLYYNNVLSKHITRLNGGTDVTSIIEKTGELRFTKAYPNPSSGKICFTGIQDPTTVRMTDAYGKVVLITCVLGEETIDIGFLSKGIYYTTLENTDGTATIRVIRD